MTENALYKKITELETEIARMKAEKRQAQIEAFVAGANYGKTKTWDAEFQDSVLLEAEARYGKP